MHLILFVLLFVGVFAYVAPPPTKNVSLLLKSVMLADKIPAKVRFMLADLDEDADPDKIDQIIQLIHDVIGQSNSDYGKLETALQNKEVALGDALDEQRAKLTEKTDAEEKWGAADQANTDAKKLYDDAVDLKSTEGSRLQTDIDGLQEIFTTICALANNCGLPVWPTDFFWTTSTPLMEDEKCLHITENSDPHSWDDNYLCWDIRKLDPGFVWSMSKPRSGMRCTQINEPADPHAWADNYLCVPEDSPYQFTWSYNWQPTQHPHLECLSWNEPSDPNAWSDNHLCAPSTE